MSPSSASIGSLPTPERHQGTVCSRDAESMYEALRTAGAAGLRAQVDDLLSIPREPVLNPCL